MTRSVQDLLETFDRLPEQDKREATAEILRRVRKYDFDPLSDDALILAAEELFLGLEAREGNDGHA